MIAAVAILWAVVATVAARIYFTQRDQARTTIVEDGRRFQAHVEFVVQGRQVVIDRLTREGVRARASLGFIRETIRRRPPRRRWLRICYRVAKEAELGYVREQA